VNAPAPAGRTLRLETPRVFLPLMAPARYKGAHGGRGSGKSHAFAEMLIERCLLRPDTRAVCIREVQKSLDQSAKRLIEDKIARYGVGAYFRVLNTHIETTGGGIILFQGMQNHTAESIKSLEGYDVAWVEEAQSLSQRSLDLLRPTLRKPDSELWFSWNPRRATDPVDAFLRGADLPPGAVVVEATYAHNPWFPDVLREEMAWDRRRDPDKYAHIWLGAYEQASEARVFRNWRIEDFDTPESATFYLGADWGYSVDPVVLVRCFIEGRTLSIDAEVYQVGCEIDATPALFDMLGCAACSPPLRSCGGSGTGHGSARRWPARGDSARPETIAYLRRHGYPRLSSAVKGARSVEEGVAFLQSYDIRVHPRCRHTIDELSTYSYARDRLTGQVVPVLEDARNHVIDALRYAIEPVRRGGAVVGSAWVEGLL
jgi:phage terminase large subunit